MEERRERDQRTPPRDRGGGVGNARARAHTHAPPALSSRQRPTALAPSRKYDTQASAIHFFLLLRRRLVPGAELPPRRRLAAIHGAA